MSKKPKRKAFSFANRFAKIRGTKAAVPRSFAALGRALGLSPEASSKTRHASLVLFLYSALYVAFFAPVLFGDSILASGDSLIYYLPNFYLPKILWEPLIMSGFPAFADPQVLAWYPPALIFSFLNSWNAFMLSAYVLASCFTYGYVYTLTRSRLASAVSGLIYGLSGFMMAHLGHVTIIHSAAWLPLIIWSLERLRTKFSTSWLIIGSIAVACSFLAHPQIFFYTQLVCVAFVLVKGWNAPVGRWRFYFSSLFIVAAGIGLAAIQWLPTFELSAWSVREAMGFTDFVSYSLPPQQIPTLFFPYLFGGSSFNPTYFGWWNLAEMSCYAGLMPLMLAAVGGFVWPRRSVSMFWIGVGLIAFLLMLGDYTPLARLTFHLPIINKFRCPARHGFEMSFAVSVLSGLGIASILSVGVSRKLVLAICAALVTTLGGLGLLLLFPGYLRKRAIAEGIEGLSLLPWANPAVGVPLIILFTSAVILICWMQRPQSRWRSSALILLLILDLSSFGWFCYWRYDAPSKRALDPPLTAARLKPILQASKQRLMPIRGGLGSVGEVMPNISRLWGIPSASGYGPLLLRRVRDMATMNPGGVLDFSALDTADQSLNLLAVRFITFPAPQSGWTSPELPEERWRHFADIDGVSVYENVWAMPRVWLASESIKLRPEDVFKVIKTSTLPDGRPFDPPRMALVERPEYAFKATTSDPEASANIVQLSNNKMSVNTRASSQSFLVTSDVYYPGWTAFLDGAPVSLAKADYALRGVSVPPGIHTVTFEFRPKSFYQGLTITIMSLLAMALIWWLPTIKMRAIRVSGISH